MNGNATSTLGHDHPNRRSFLELTDLATAAAVVIPAAHRAHAAALTATQREKLTADDIIAMMKAGNGRFSFRGAPSEGADPTNVR